MRGEDLTHISIFSSNPGMKDENNNNSNETKSEAIASVILSVTRRNCEEFGVAVMRLGVQQQSIEI